MAVGLRLQDGRDFDQVFARRVSGIIYPATGFRAQDGRDVIDVYENLRVTRGPITNYRRNDGGDLYNYLDTQTGSFVAFNESSNSGQVPSPGPADWGQAYATAQTDGFMRYDGDWQGAHYSPWFSNPQSGIGSIGYIYYEPQSTPGLSAWSGTGQWRPISSSPGVGFRRVSPASGDASAVCTVYFAWASAPSTIVQTAYITFTASGRNRDL